MADNKRIIIVAGHYGAGKTNVACNLAVLKKKESPSVPVTLIDVDTVNPYFRAADAVSMMNGLGIRTIIPEYANTNVDLPTLPAEIASVFLSDEAVIFDVGGDDGAAALGVYERDFNRVGYGMYYVINMYRPLTDTPETAVAIMREIEDYSRLRFTAVINNSNLGDETTADDIVRSLPYAEETARLAGLPLIHTSYFEEVAGVTGIKDPLVMKKYTKMLF